MTTSGIFSYAKTDTMAGVVVFLVALPLCLGIAIACGVPPVSGLIAGIIGGAVVPLISRSHVSVSGPAAGLTSIVLVEVGRIGLGAFLTATALAGVFQVILGALRAGRFSTLVPSAVVKGMLAAIGATINRFCSFSFNITLSIWVTFSLFSYRVSDSLKHNTV